MIGMSRDLYERLDAADRIADLMVAESSHVNKKHKPQSKPMSLDELLFPEKSQESETQRWEV